MRFNVIWWRTAPAVPPPGFSAADPSSPGYDWASTDAAVREMSRRGLQVLLNLSLAPAWAEGAGRPASAPPGTWRPSPSAFAEFARAAAVRYSGHFRDPLNHRAFLPRVRYWQPWNEPNVPVYLNPQWIPTASGPVAASPSIYRQLLNAFYGAVKGVSRSNFVVTAGNAPYGDPPGVSRIPPVEFVRDLFCLQNDPQLTPQPCSQLPELDALGHSAYGVSTPFWHAFQADDVAPADMYKLARVLRAAERSHHVLPAGRKRLWVTEVSWDSNPPDPNGIPVQMHAAFVEQTMYVLWHQGVDTILWFQLVDKPPIPDLASTVQGGMYFVDGRPKPAAQALRFPFVTQRHNKRRVEAWGRAPRRGKLRIERRVGHRWKIVRKLRVGKHHVFDVSLKLRGHAKLRARMRGVTSLTWSQSG